MSEPAARGRRHRRRRRDRRGHRRIIGRTGAFVVTVDPLVSVDGSERLPQPEETTAGRIVAAGGAARASAVSVTDEPAVRRLFQELADEFGGLDAVVNVAGISRPTSFAEGSDDDWLSVLSVHLDGYRNVLGAALPLMAAAGRGHILGVTSGSGWRPADAGAYGCAKRAVASLTWQLGRHAPAGVVINAISPIAATRMVAAALGGTLPTSGAATGGLSLGSMPAPEHLGPLGAHLVDDTFTSCHGRVLFAGGSEVAVIDEPRLLEVVRSDDVPSLRPLHGSRDHHRAGPGRGPPGQRRRQQRPLRIGVRRGARRRTPDAPPRVRALSSPTGPRSAAAVPLRCRHGA